MLSRPSTQTDFVEANASHRGHRNRFQPVDGMMLSGEALAIAGGLEAVEFRALSGVDVEIEIYFLERGVGGGVAGLKVAW